MLGRRSFVLGATFTAACSRPGHAEGVPFVLPPMPVPGHEPAPRGRVGAEVLEFGAEGRAVVVVPSWTPAEQPLPVLVALHGRGEAQKGSALGVLGWPRDYAMLRAMDRLCKPPLTAVDFEGLVEPARLDQINRELAARPFGGLIVVCPYLPDLDLRIQPAKPDPVAPYADLVIAKVLARVRSRYRVGSSAASVGIDGVSLGGAVALRVGLANPAFFGATGSLQAAIRADEIPMYTAMAVRARSSHPSLNLRLVTSHADYFREAITRMSHAWRAAGVEHEFADVPGPHDYPFNRGPGAIEMLLWHDRKLARS